MIWTLDAVGGGEYPQDNPGFWTGIFSRHLNVHVSGEAWVDVDNSWLADPFTVTGVWDDLETQTVTYLCGSANPVQDVTQRWVWTVDPSASQPTLPVFTVVDTAPDGSLFVRDPFALSLWQGYPSTAVLTFASTGADCTGPLVSSGTQTYPNSPFPVFSSPGSIPATDESGTHFSKDTDVTLYVDPSSLVPIVFHWHIEIFRLDSCSVEVCDGLDNDCDGRVDEDFDVDGDTYTTCGDVTNMRTNGLPGGQDCDDGNAATYPGATEVCNDVDDDCDGLVDEGSIGPTWYLDGDGDTYGNAATSQQACSQPNGYVSDNTDCDDTELGVHPGATEICNGFDDDCDGLVDEGSIGPTWHRDADGDTYGSATTSQQACSQPTGYVSDNTDCDDTKLGVHPGATEECNGFDDDCDGLVDEGSIGPTWYRDADGDTYGSAATSQQACSQPNGYVSDNTDCDDTKLGVHPGATEICNDVDDDCDGLVDEGSIGPTWYRDADGDTYGSAATSQQVCSQPTGYVSDNTDCDDNLATAYPGAVESCDGHDNDCDGQVDEGNPGGGFLCSTGQLGVCSDGITQCVAGVPSCLQLNFPSSEVCDALDNDCDGVVNNGNPGGGVACNTGQAGVCSAGTTICSGTSLTCVPNVGPSPEVCDTLDNDCDGFVNEGGVCTSTAPLLTSLSPASVWVGLQSDTDAGIRFDLAAKVYLNDVEIGSGQLDSEPGGSAGFDNARLDIIKLKLLAPVAVVPSSVFRIDVLVRNACRGSGRNTGGATLWYNGQPNDHGPRQDAGSRFDAKIGATKRDYYLRQSAVLSTTAGARRLSADQDAGLRCSAFKSFGSWTMTLP